jgi:hypothetical protein
MVDDELLTMTKKKTNAQAAVLQVQSMEFL